MVLYKYLPAERLDVLQNARIRFTQLGDFNDLFEGKPAVSGLSSLDFVTSHLAESLPRLLREKYDALPSVAKTRLTFAGFCELVKPHLPTIQAKSEAHFVAVSPVIAKGVAGQLAEGLDPLIGILSLSEVNNDPLMWAHYTDSHRGFVIGFDPENGFFDRRVNDSDWLRHLCPVEYMASASKNLVDLTEVDLLYTKDVAWAYEKEHRIARPLSEAACVIDRNPYPIHLFEFPKDAIVEVIIGAKMRPEHIDAIDQVLTDEHQYSRVTKRSIRVDSSSKSLLVE